MKSFAMLFLGTMTLAAAAVTAAPPGPEYGRRLEINEVGTGPVMGVATAGTHLYAIGGGKLFVLENSQPDKPRIVGQLGGLGQVRQIAVQAGVAYVTSREDGLFIVDVRQPHQPVLLSHYDTIELATGIAVFGEVAAVANRFAGVELIDISDPRRPRHLSTVRVGEAQSVVYQDGYVYAGIWSGRQLAVIDVHNPRHPRAVATGALDGQGDGVAVRGNLALVATGHHSAARPAAKPGDPGFGRGHGLEIFDISQPTRPRFLSRVKLPQFYRIGMDMWGVVLSGDHAFVHDTYNGLFVIDIHDPAHPKCVAYRQLPVAPGREDPTPVAGLTVASGRVYLAGAWSDLYVASPGVPAMAEPPAPAGLKVTPEEPLALDPHLRQYRTEGQVHAVMPWREGGQGPLLLVAAGTSGLHVVRLCTQFERLAEYPTRGFATDVAAYGDRVYVAEGDGGLSVWRSEPAGRLVRTGEYKVRGRSIRQVVLAANGTVAFLAVGGDVLQAVDLSQGDTPRKLLEERHLGLFYRLPISPSAAADRSVLCQWHVTGLYEYEAVGGKARFTGYQYAGRLGSSCGAVAYGDRWLATTRGGYFELSTRQEQSPDEIRLIKVRGTDLAGKPSLAGRVLFTAHPYLGTVHAVDIGDLGHPKLLGTLSLAEHPGFVRGWRKLALVPAGYQGLLAWDYGQEKAG